MELKGTFIGHRDSVKCLAFDQTGSFLFSGGNDHTIRTWDLKKMEERDSIQAHDSWVQCLAMQNGTDMLVSGGEDKKLVFWRVKQVQGEESIEEGMRQSQTKLKVMFQDDEQEENVKQEVKGN